MSDYNSSLPIRTENPGDAIVKIADATLPSQQLAVNADGSVNITDNGGSITVDGTVAVTATDLDIRNLSATQDNVAISDGTDTLAINADGSLNATVTATDLDIRDLNFATDSVEARQASHDNLNANANIQVGNTDVSNANPVPVSDAGGSLTVDATDLDIRDLAFATDKVDVSGSSVSVTGTVDVSATNLDIRDLAFATDKVDVSGSSVTVTATDLDIRNLSASQDSVRIGDGTDFLAVNADGSINVVTQDDPGTERVNYNTAAAVAAGASSNHDFVVTNGGRLYQVWASGSGKLKAEVQIETGASTNVFNTIIVGFNSTATTNIDMMLAKYALVPVGARVRVIRTNRDNQSQDVYSTIVLVEA